MNGKQEIIPYEEVFRALSSTGGYDAKYKK